MSLGYRDIERLVYTLQISKRDIDKAVVRAINKTLRTLRNHLARSLRDETRVKLEYIQQRMKVFRASVKNMEGGISVVTRSFPATLGPFYPTPKGVNVGGEEYSRAWVSKNGYKKIYQRLGRSRYPIKEIRIPFHDSYVAILSREAKWFERKFMSNLLYELKNIGGLYG